MKYEKCLTCKQLGIDCDGPNFLAMDTIELGQWCDEKRKTIPGMTYDRIEAETGISKTAVYNFLKGKHPDCRLETIRPVVKLITDGKWDDNPCGSVTNAEKAAYEERIRQLKKDIAHLEDKNKDLAKTNESMQTLVTNTNARYTKDKDFLRGQIKSKSIANVTLSVLFGLALAVIIGALIVDKLDPSKGFFWLRSFLGGEGGKWWPFKG